MDNFETVLGKDGEKSKASLPSINDLKKQSKGVTSTSAFAQPQKYDSAESKYGEDITPFTDLNEVRGQRQSLTEKYTNGAIRALGTASTSFAEGTVGALVGTTEALATGDVTKLYNGAFGQGLDKINESLAEAFPIYYTKEQQESILNANFIPDKLFNGAGYMAGAIGSGYTGGKVLKALGKLAFTNKLTPAMLADANAGQKLITAANATKLATGLEEAAVGALSAHGESAAEARGARKATYEKLVTQFQEKHGTLPNDIQLAEINRLSDAAGNVDYMINLAVTGGTTMNQFGRLMTGGYEPSKKQFWQIVRDRAGKYVTPELSTFGKAVQRSSPYLKNGALPEVIQEFTQYGTEIGTSDYYARKYDKEAWDSMAEVIQSTKDAVINTVNSKEGFESGLLGGILGAGGGVLHNENKQKDINTQNAIKVLGEQKLNDIVKKIETASAIKTYENDQQVALANKDVFEYKNLDYDKFKTLVSSRIETNQFDSFMEELDEQKSLTEEQFKEKFGFPKNEKLPKQVPLLIEEIKAKANYVKEVKDAIDIQYPYNDPSFNMSNRQFNYMKEQLFHTTTTLDNVNKRITTLKNQITGLSTSSSPIEIFDSTKAFEDGYVVNYLAQVNKNIEERRTINPADSNITKLEDYAKDIVKLEDRRREFADTYNKLQDVETTKVMADNTAEAIANQGKTPIVPPVDGSIKTEFEEFTDSGKVSKKTLTNIANKIKDGKELTKEEQAYHAAKTSEVEEILKGFQKGETKAAVKTPVKDEVKTGTTKLKDGDKFTLEQDGIKIKFKVENGKVSKVISTLDSKGNVISDKNKALDTKAKELSKSKLEELSKLTLDEVEAIINGKPKETVKAPVEGTKKEDEQPKVNNKVLLYNAAKKLNGFTKRANEATSSEGLAEELNGIVSEIQKDSKAFAEDIETKDALNTLFKQAKAALEALEKREGKSVEEEEILITEEGEKLELERESQGGITMLKTSATSTEKREAEKNADRIRWNNFVDSFKGDVNDIKFEVVNKNHPLYNSLLSDKNKVHEKKTGETGVFLVLTDKDGKYIKDGKHYLWTTPVKNVKNDYGYAVAPDHYSRVHEIEYTKGDENVETSLFRQHFDSNEVIAHKEWRDKLLVAPVGTYVKPSFKSPGAYNFLDKTVKENWNSPIGVLFESTKNVDKYGEFTVPTKAHINPKTKTKENYQLVTYKPLGSETNSFKKLWLGALYFKTKDGSFLKLSSRRVKDSKVDLATLTSLFEGLQNEAQVGNIISAIKLYVQMTDSKKELANNTLYFENGIIHYGKDGEVAPEDVREDSDFLLFLGDRRRQVDNNRLKGKEIKGKKVAPPHLPSIPTISKEGFIDYNKQIPYYEFLFGGSKPAFTINLPSLDETQHENSYFGFSPNSIVEDLITEEEKEIVSESKIKEDIEKRRKEELETLLPKKKERKEGEHELTGIFTSDNVPAFYKQLLEAAQQGKDKIAGIKEPLIAKIKDAVLDGRIKTDKDVYIFLNDRSIPINAKYDAELAALESTKKEEESEVEESEEAPKEEKKVIKKRVLPSKDRPSFRLATEEEYVKEDIKKAEQWYKDRFKDNNFRVTKELIDNQAFGQFYKGIVYLWEQAEEGTGYHEAYHKVEEEYLTEEQVEALHAEMEKALGRTMSKEEGKEHRAEDFRNYMLSGQKAINGQPVRNTFFRRLYNYIKSLLTGKKTIEQVYSKLASKKGYYNSKKVRTSSAKLNRSQLLGMKSIESKELLDGITHGMFSILLQNDITPNNLVENIDSESIEKAYNYIYKQLESQYKALEAIDEDVITEEQVKLYDDLYNILTNWDSQVVPAHKNVLRPLIKLEPTEAKEEQELTENKAEESEEELLEDLGDKPDGDDVDTIEKGGEIYKSADDINPITTISNNTKMLFASLAEMKREVSKKGKVTYTKVLNKYGQPTVVKEGWSKVYSNLSVRLNGLLTSENIWRELNILKEDYPYIKDLMDKLGEPSKSKSKEKFKLWTDFKKDMNKYNSKGTSTIYNKANGDIVVLDANSDNLKRQIRDSWKTNMLTSKAVSEVKGKKVLNVDMLLETETPQEFLELLGLDIDGFNFFTAEEDDAETVNEAISGIKLSLDEEEGIDASNLFDERLAISPRMHELLNLAVKHSKKAIPASYIDSGGKQKYGLTNHNYFTIAASEINNASTLDDYHESNPWMDSVHTQGSVRLASIFDENGNRRDGNAIQVNKRAGFNAAGETGKVTTKLEAGDKVVEELNNVLLDGTSSILRVSDKSEEASVKVNYYVTSEGIQSILPVPISEVSDSFDSEEVRIIFKNYFLAELERIRSRRIDGTGKDIEVYGVDVQDKDDKGNLLFDEDGKPVYKKDSSNAANWTIFQDILQDSTKEALKPYLNSRKNVVTPKLLEQVNKDVIAYLDKLTFGKDALSTESIFNEYGIGAEVSEISEPVWENGKKTSKKNIIRAKGRLGISNQLSDVDLNTIKRAFTVNQFINAVEDHKLFMGDKAFYKDPFKRYSAFSGNKKFAFVDSEVLQHINSNQQWGEYDVKDTTRTITVADVMSVSDMDVFINALEGIHSKEDVLRIYEDYMKMTEADAQALGNIIFYKQFKELASEWTEKEEEQYNYEMAYEIVATKDKGLREVSDELYAKAKEVLEEGNPGYALMPLKAQYAGPQVKDKMYAPTFHKYSIAPLFYRLVEGTNLESKYLDMIENEIGYQVFSSGVKVGALVNENNEMPSFYTEEGNPRLVDDTTPIQDIYYRFLGIQVDIAPKVKTKVIFGTQFRKLFMANSFNAGVPFDYTGTKEEWNELGEEEKVAISPTYGIHKEFIGIIDSMVQDNWNRLVEELGFEEDKTTGEFKQLNVKKLVDLLKQESIDRQLADNLIDSLQVNTEGNLLYSIDSLVNRPKLESMLFALVNSRVIKQTMPGDGMIQKATTGTESKSTRIASAQDAKGNPRYLSNDLAFYRKGEDGKTLSMQVKVPLTAQFNDLKKLVKGYKTMSPEVLLAEVNKMIKEESFDKRVLQMIGYRIPTQGLNSIDFMEIVEFIPDAAGNTIILPTEIVAKSGGDFDIDKLNIFRANFELKANKSRNQFINEQSNTKYTNEEIDSILKDKTHNDYSTLKVLEKEYEKFLDSPETDYTIKYKSYGSKIEESKIYLEYKTKIDKINDTINKSKKIQNKKLDELFKQKEYDRYAIDELFYNRRELGIQLSFLNTDIYELRKLNEDKDEAVDKLMSAIFGEDVEESYNTELESLENEKKSIEDKLSKVNKTIDSLKIDLKDRGAIEERISKKKSTLDKYYSQKENLFKERQEAINNIDSNLPITDFNKASIQEKQNRIIELAKSMLENGKNFEQLTTPNTVALLKEELTKEIREARGISTPKKSFTKELTFGHILEQFKYFLGGKAGVGVAAIHNTFHTLFQEADTKISLTKQELKDRLLKEVLVEINFDVHRDSLGRVVLGEKLDKAGRTISETISQFINAYVDVAKDPFYKDLNAGLDAANVYFFLIHAGADIRTISYFMNQPVILELLNAEAANNSIIAEIRGKESKKDIADALHDKYQKLRGRGHYFESMILSTDSNELLYKYMSGEKENKGDSDYYAAQAQFLEDFLKYREYANDLTEFTRTLNFDTSKIGSFAKGDAVQESINKIERGESIFSSEERNKILDNSIVGSFNKLLPTQRMYSPLFITQSKDFKNTRKEIFSIIKPFKTDDKDKLYKLIDNDFINYITQRFYNDGDVVLGERVEELSRSVDNLAKRLADIKQSGVIKDNLLLNQLQAMIAEVEGDKNNISIYSRRLETSEQNDMTQAYRELLEYQGDEMELIQEFAKDLTKFGIIQSGLANSPITYLGLIPYDEYGDIVEQARINYERVGIKDTIHKDFIARFFLKNIGNSVVAKYSKPYYSEATDSMNQKGNVAYSLDANKEYQITFKTPTGLYYSTKHPLIKDIKLDMNGYKLQDFYLNQQMSYIDLDVEPIEENEEGEVEETSTKDSFIHKVEVTPDIETKIKAQLDNGVTLQKMYESGVTYGLNPKQLEDTVDKLLKEEDIEPTSKVEVWKGFWTRKQVEEQKDKVFLFGDNTEDAISGYVPSSTQAVIRGLPNAIGIVTKRDRGTKEDSYLSDYDLIWFEHYVDTQIAEAKASGKTIVIPADGIGTGKAMLKEKAPKLYEYLNQKLNELSTSESNKPIVFQEDPSVGYRERTMKNASADATIALAVDFTSAGEKLTKSSVLNQGKLYIPIDANSLEVTEERVDKIVDMLNSVDAETLNIAGNGIYTMKGKYTQEQVDEFTYNLLKAVLESPNLDTKIKSIRSGGQTGFDEAGAKAGFKLGLPTLVLAPKGWKYRVIANNSKGYEDLADEKGFKARFESKTESSKELTKEDKSELNKLYFDLKAQYPSLSGQKYKEAYEKARDNGMSVEEFKVSVVEQLKTCGVL